MEVTPMDWLAKVKFYKILTLSKLSKEELLDMKDGEIKNGVVAILTEKCKKSYKGRQDINYLYGPNLLEIEQD
jgi:RecB family endonuclease NucS